MLSVDNIANGLSLLVKSAACDTHRDKTITPNAEGEFKQISRSACTEILLIMKIGNPPHAMMMAAMLEILEYS